MITDDQVRVEKLQYDISREAAKISALSSGKINKFEYLTGEEILLSNQQQIIEQAKFTYSLWRKGFPKQVEMIEHQKTRWSFKRFKDSKPNEQTKAIEGKSNNQSNASNIFNDLINERKSTMNKLYESVDMNKLYFKYEGNTKDVSFYEYMDSKELFNKIKNNQIKFDDALKKQKLSLNKLNDVKISRKTPDQREVLPILKIFTILEKKILIFLETILK